MKFIIKDFAETQTEMCNDRFSSLGGFAEYQLFFDEKEEKEYNEFNYCLSQQYVNAFYDENFSDLGELSTDFMENFAFWADFLEDSKEIVSQIVTGEFKTKNNRSFKEAIIKSNNQEYAETWLDMADNYTFAFHPMDKKLLLFYLMGENVNYNMINKKLDIECKTNQEYVAYLKTIIQDFINIIEKEDSKENITKIIKKISLFIRNLRWKKDIGSISIQDIDVNNFVARKVLKQKS